MIQNMKAVICDWCNSAIDYYEGSKAQAQISIQETDTVVVGDKHFCDDECYAMYRKN